jgi:hypothetical protein
LQLSNVQALNLTLPSIRLISIRFESCKRSERALALNEGGTSKLKDSDRKFIQFTLRFAT